MQVLLTVMMVLKKAVGPAILAALSIVPTTVFRNIAIARFHRAYVNPGLLQTSKLDGWDSTKATSVQNREEFRKWLVDCHKASFVPICLAGSDNFLTAEPAVVVPTDRDQGIGALGVERRFSKEVRKSPQHGAVFRRVPNIELLESI